MTILFRRQTTLKCIMSSMICKRYLCSGSNAPRSAGVNSSMFKSLWQLTDRHKGNKYLKQVFINQCHCKSILSRSLSTGTSSDGGSEDVTSQTEQDAGRSNLVHKLPKRVVKRLQKQGVSETEYLAKVNALSAAEFTRFDRLSAGSTFSGSREELEEMLKNMSTDTGHLSEADSFPSDMKRFKQWERQQASASTKPKVAPSLTSVILFPGQGSQFVGMGKKLLNFPGVQDLYDEASSILGYNLLDMCINGPKSELDKTVYCQPAVMITSLAAVEKCREEHSNAVESCVATAGFSVGEFAALVFSGVISFPDAVKLVKVRAEAMQKASERIGSGMLTVFLAHDSDLKQAIKTAKEYCLQRRNIQDPVCGVANYLFPECKVLAGHEEALEFIATNAKDFRILRTKRLQVSGAFHTSLMETAVLPLRRALEGMKLGSPKIPVYSNVTSQPYHVKTNFSYVLSQQLIKPVKWEQIMHEVYSRKQGEEFPNTYEMGPGKQMGTLLKQVNMQAYKQYHSVDV